MASPILLALALAVLAFGPEGALAFITCQCYCDSTYMGTLSNSYSTCSAYNCAANYRYSGYSCYYVYARTYDPYIIAAICLGVAILVGVLVCVFRRRQSKTTVVTYTAPAYTGPPQYSSPNPQYVGQTTTTTYGTQPAYAAPSY